VAARVVSKNGLSHWGGRGWRQELSVKKLAFALGWQGVAARVVSKNGLSRWGGRGWRRELSVKISFRVGVAGGGGKSCQ